MQTGRRIDWAGHSGRAFAIIAAGLVVLCGFARAETTEQIPDPRPGSCVVDLTNTLRPESAKSLNELCGQVRSQTNGEIVVAVIHSVGGEKPRKFATRLFNTWRIGDAQHNSGILLFVAIDDRAAEAILGIGIDSDADVRVSDRIMEEEIVARFKAGDPNGAILRGATAYAERLLRVHLTPEQVEEVGQAEQPLSESPPADSPATDQPSLSEASARSSGDGPSGWLWGGALGGGGGGLLLAVRFFLRRRPRRCPKCRRQMVRLEEAADDQFLSEPERLEERLGSVDYDVWLCEECNEVIQLRYGALFTRYRRCPQCSYKTKSSSTQTIRSATYYSSGLAEVHEVCRNCNYSRKYTRAIPQKNRPSTNSSGGFSSRSSSSRSSSSGGSSSGRGSSGSW